MKGNNLLTLVITLTLGIILTGSLLMPVVNSAIEDNQTTLLNNTGIKWHMVEADETVTASYDGSVCTVNGETIVFGATYSFIAADTFCCRWTSSEVTFKYYDTENQQNVTVKNWSLTASDGTCTVTNLQDNTTATYEYNWLFVPAATSDADTDWVMTTGSGTYYVTDDTPVYASSSDGQIVIQGTYGDLTVTSAAQEAAYTVNDTELSGYEENAYVFTSFVITAVNDTEYTFNRLILPSEVVLTNEGGSALISLYSAIPVLVIVSIVIASIGIFTTRRD